jgi:hypothetical protein
MSQRLITIATFDTVVEGNLALNRLEDAGIVAFLADEEVGAIWTLANAIRGIKLQVEESDADEALVVLADKKGRFQVATPELDETETGHDWRERITPIDEHRIVAPPEHAETREPAHAETSDADPALTARELDAVRALRGAVVGLLVPPLQFYVFWLLFKVFVSEERLTADKRRLALMAAVINIPAVLFLGFILRRWLLD